MFKLDLEKAEEPGIKLPTLVGSSKKQENSRKTSTSALLTMPKPLTVWITTNCGNFFLIFKLLLLFFYFTILYWFCHTSTWINHGCTHVPHPEPSSHLPPHTIPLGHPSAPAPSVLYPASNLDWWFISIWKILKEIKHQTTVPASWEICTQVKKQHLELDMEQQTGSK